MPVKAGDLCKNPGVKIAFSRGWCILSQFMVFNKFGTVFYVYSLAHAAY